MAKPALCSESEFVEMFESLGPSEMARALGCNYRSVMGRRSNLQRKLKRAIHAPPHRTPHNDYEEHPHRIHLTVKDGVVIAGSDAHYWPGIVSTAHKAFVKFCRDLSPVAVIKNGDELDGSTISKHQPIGWEHRPALIDEMETCKERLFEITQAATRAKRIWCLGNHDSRFETRLAHIAPEYAHVHGVHLKDHFPDWEPCWSVWINNDVVVKHRFRGGIHATHNNVMWAGKTMITGHLHSQQVRPFSDYNGTRWGVDLGTMADPYGPQFVDYTEDNPKNWRSAFGVLTFHKGRLLMPELCLVFDKNHIQFRGQVIEV